MRRNNALRSIPIQTTPWRGGGWSHGWLGMRCVIIAILLLSAASASEASPTPQQQQQQQHEKEGFCANLCKYQHEGSIDAGDGFTGFTFRERIEFIAHHNEASSSQQQQQHRIEIRDVDFDRDFTIESHISPRQVFLVRDRSVATNHTDGDSSPSFVLKHFNLDVHGMRKDAEVVLQNEASIAMRARCIDIEHNNSQQGDDDDGDEYINKCFVPIYGIFFSNNNNNSNSNSNSNRHHISKSAYVKYEYMKDGDMLSWIRRSRSAAAAAAASAHAVFDHDDDDDVIRTVFLRLAKCLQRLHDNGIIHNDLKLENVMLLVNDTNSGGKQAVPRPMITDFGLSVDTRCGPWLWRSLAQSSSSSSSSSDREKRNNNNNNKNGGGGGGAGIRYGSICAPDWNNPAVFASADIQRLGMMLFEAHFLTRAVPALEKHFARLEQEAEELGEGRVPTSTTTVALPMSGIPTIIYNNSITDMFEFVVDSNDGLGQHNSNNKAILAYPRQQPQPQPQPQSRGTFTSEGAPTAADKQQQQQQRRGRQRVVLKRMRAAFSGSAKEFDTEVEASRRLLGLDHCFVQLQAIYKPNNRNNSSSSNNNSNNNSSGSGSASSNKKSSSSSSSPSPPHDFNYLQFPYFENGGDLQSWLQQQRQRSNKINKNNNNGGSSSSSTTTTTTTTTTTEEDEEEPLLQLQQQQQQQQQLIAMFSHLHSCIQLMHCHGIAHRGLSLRNIILIPAGDNSQDLAGTSTSSLLKPIIGDFGLSTFHHHHHHHHHDHHDDDAHQTPPVAEEESNRRTTTATATTISTTQQSPFVRAAIEDMRRLSMLFLKAHSFLVTPNNNDPNTDDGGDDNQKPPAPPPEFLSWLLPHAQPQHDDPKDDNNDSSMSVRQSFWQLVHLLGWMMHDNPRLRPSIAQVLQHPYFATLR